MTNKKLLRLNIEEVSEPEVSQTIRYLDFDQAPRQEPNDLADFLICSLLLVMFVACLGFLYLM